LKLEWCKARARRDRWKEEVSLLLEEMRRLDSYGQWEANVWDGRKGARAVESQELQEGLTAFASEQRDRRLNRIKSRGKQWVPILEHVHDMVAGKSRSALLEVELDDEEEDDSMEDGSDGLD
jgi:hypothetical protein